MVGIRKVVRFGDIHVFYFLKEKMQRNREIEILVGAVC